jgi:hypothetical protein
LAALLRYTFEAVCCQSFHFWIIIYLQ